MSSASELSPEILSQKKVQTQKHLCLVGTRHAGLRTQSFFDRRCRAAVQIFIRVQLAEVQLFAFQIDLVNLLEWHFSMQEPMRPRDDHRILEKLRLIRNGTKTPHLEVIERSLEHCREAWKVLAPKFGESCKSEAHGVSWCFATGAKHSKE